MVKASRKTKTIVARPPKYRDQLLKPVVDSDNCKDDEIFQPGLFEHYVVRPEELEKICICDFASYFEFSSFKKKKNLKQRMIILMTQIGMVMKKKKMNF